MAYKYLYYMKQQQLCIHVCVFDCISCVVDSLSYDFVDSLASDYELSVLYGYLGFFFLNMHMHVYM